MSINGKLSIILALLGTLGHATAASWLTGFDTAKAQAAAGARPILINFTGSDWCPACQQIQPVLNSSEFLAFAEEHLVLLEVDFPRYKGQAALQQAANRQLATQYRISGYPTLLLVNAAGGLIAQIPPSLKPAQFITTLRHQLGLIQTQGLPVLPPRRDSDFPREPVRELPMFGGAVTHPPRVHTDLVVRSISGVPARRFALINNETLSAGESAWVKLGASKVRVQCEEVREKSVLVRVDGEPVPRELRLSEIRR